MSRAEKDIVHMREEQLMQEARSMRDNIVFYNIPESSQENVLQVVRDFLKTEMRIGDNEASKISFERVHRMGQKDRTGNRAIVAKVNNEGRQIIFRNARNLDRRKNYGVSEQLPRELAERKKQLLPQYKDARRNKKDVKWAVDKLVVDGKVQAVKKDAINDINIDPTQKAVALQGTLKNSALHVHEGSSFTAQHFMRYTLTPGLLAPLTTPTHTDSRLLVELWNITRMMVCGVLELGYWMCSRRQRSRTLW